MCNLNGVFGDMIAWEEGELDQAQEVALFQNLVDQEIVWTLQGTYGRRAMELIGSGAVVERCGEKAATTVVVEETSI